MTVRPLLREEDRIHPPPSRYTKRGFSARSCDKTAVNASWWCSLMILVVAVGVARGGPLVLEAGKGFEDVL